MSDSRMSKFGISQSVPRAEDPRFLTGAGRFVDDIAPNTALHGLVLRAPIAHANIRSIDISAATDMPGVALVMTAATLEETVTNTINYAVLDVHVTRPSATPIRPILARDRVRFVGEPVALIVATSIAAARDAAEMIDIDYDELPVHMDLAPGGPAVHEEAPDNVVFDWAFGDAEATAAVFDAAPHHVSMDLIDNRIISNPMEPRGCFAEMVGTRLHFTYGGQGVWGLRDQLAQKLAMDTADVRVMTPDVGGSFGTKAFPYPEYFLIAEAARRLGQPVRWMADRSETMMSDNGGRDLRTTAEAAFDADHRLLAVRIHSLANMGAQNSGNAQFIQTELALKVLTGAYDVQQAHFSVQGIYTNTTQIDAYRGAGRPEAIYVIERLMDTAARELGQDPIAFKQKNFIRREQFPYRSASGELYDVGDFDRVLTAAIEHADVAGFAARKAASAAAGKLRGIGLSFYVESILGATVETTKIAFAEDGFVDLFVGTQSNGQGHETAYAQILHSRTGIPFDKLRFVQGDSDLIAKGGGTGGSRSVTMQGNSISATAAIMIEKFRPLAEEELEAAAADILFEDGNFIIAGTDRRVAVTELANIARQRGLAELLVTEHEYELPARSYPNGAHFAEVEIDPETGETKCVKYTICDDFGLLINPMLAAGQAHGGVAQGIGQAITERVVHDPDGQLLTATFMDYGMPRADDMPHIAFHTELVPSTANEIGMKGCGEAGTVGALAAVTNAALDAVWDLGVRRVDMPMTPEAMWARIQEAKT